jgi:CRP/FNR family transcriptional regulator, cyclic AMP receptor protein
MEGRRDLVESLASLALFSDLTRPELESVAHEFEEEMFAEGQRVIRQGLSGSNLFVIIEGQAIISRDGGEVTRLGPGEIFGEISVLTGVPPTADVVAGTLLRCLVIPGPETERFLLARPAVMLKMLKTEARRVHSAYEWRG